MKFIKTSIALGTGSLMMFANTALVFGSDVVINKTGAQSTNKVVMSTNCVNMVSQSNTSTVSNEIAVSQNTGYNSASKNTGNGEVSTGDASVEVFVANAGNSNELTGTPTCCCEMMSDMVTTKVANTGYKSTNKVKVVKSSMTKTKQKNVSAKLNAVAAMQETGMNKSDKNTHDGAVDSGKVEVVVEVVNEGDSNTN